MNVRENEEGREGESAVMEKTKKEERLRQNHTKRLSASTADFTNVKPVVTF